MRTHHRIAIGGILAAVSYAALTAGASAMGAPSVIAMNQRIKGGEVSITYANIPKSGYLVIHLAARCGWSKSLL